MSTAILISGQLRTFAQCYPTQRWHVLRHFTDPHFFITVQGDNCTTPNVIADLIAEYGADHVHYDPRTDPDVVVRTDNVVYPLPETPRIINLTAPMQRAYNLAPYTNAAPAHQLLLQHWYQNEVWKHFQQVGRVIPNPPSFDTIIRIRADLWFHSFDDPFASEYPVSGTPCPLPNACFTPWWGRFGGINDRLAIMGPEAAKYYFTVFDHIPELLAAGCPFHPETLVKAALERGNVDLHETLRTEFTTLRQNGQHRPPEIAPWDIAHAALRAA